MGALKYFNLIAGLTYATLVVAIIFRILHLPSAHTINLASAMLMAIFIIICLVEVNGSEKFSSSEKVMWNSGLIIFSPLTAFIYTINGRKKLFRTYRILKR